MWKLIFFKQKSYCKNSKEQWSTKFGFHAQIPKVEIWFYFFNSNKQRYICKLKHIQNLNPQKCSKGFYL
jgi:hypothetical protein